MKDGVFLYPFGVLAFYSNYVPLGHLFVMVRGWGDPTQRMN